LRSYSFWEDSYAIIFEAKYIFILSLVSLKTVGIGCESLGSFKDIKFEI